MAHEFQDLSKVNGVLDEAPNYSLEKDPFRQSSLCQFSLSRQQQ